MKTNRILQVLRYCGSYFFEPIVRGSLWFAFSFVSCRFEGHTSTKVESWKFIGPNSFTGLVKRARTRIEQEDPDLLKMMTDSYTVIYLPENLNSLPAWRYGTIPDSYLAWGEEGVVAAWLYLYFHSLSYRKSRWLLAIAENSRNAAIDGRKQTGEWLRQHHFPSELVDCFLNLSQR